MTLKMSQRRSLHPRNLWGRVFFLSDPHFFHNNILLYDEERSRFLVPGVDQTVHAEYLANGRQWKGKRGRISDESVYRMNQAILDNINAAVVDPEQDTVIINGDFVFGGETYRRNADYARSQIDCRDVRLVFGNHDRPKDVHDLFTYCYDQVAFNAGGLSVVCNHFPMISWDKSHHGVVHAYGHVHGLYARPGQHPLARPDLWAAVDIGVMTNDFRPYTTAQIVDRVRPIWANQDLARSTRVTHHLF